MFTAHMQSTEPHSQFLSIWGQESCQPLNGKHIHVHTAHTMHLGPDFSQHETGELSFNKCEFKVTHVIYF